MSSSPAVKPVVWSYSSLKDFTGCPRRYHEIKVLKNYEFKKTDAIIYGEEVHKACEDYVKDGTEIPERFSQFRGVVEALKNIPGDKYPEYKMGLREDKTPCDFKDKDVWVRGIVDLLIVNNDKAFIVDYKTGSDRYPDANQLKLMAAMVFAHFPNVTKIKASLVFLVKNNVVKEKYLRENLDKIWERFDADVYKLRQAFANDVWNPNPTPLCRYCAVKSCEYNSDH